MPIDKNGFLGSQIQQIRQQIRSRHLEVFDLCSALNEFAQHIKFQLEVPIKNHARKAAACLFIRVLNGFQAVIILHQMGLASEAVVVLRSVCEAFFYLKAVRDKPDFVDTLLRDHFARRLKNLNYLLNNKRASFSNEDIAVAEAEKAKIERRGISGKETIQVQALAPEMYSLYRYYSLDVHPGLDSASKYLQQDDTEGEIYIEWGPSEHDIEINLSSACAVLLDSISLVLGMFGLEEPTALATLRAQLSAFQSRLNSSH
jgi:hypothetical protein